MKAIVAVDSNWGIGFCGHLLFNLPKDMKHFRDTTIGKTIIYGTKTLKSLPDGKPLKNRTNIIMSRNPDLEVPGATVVHDIKELKAAVDINSEDVYVIGGEQIYKLLLPYCSHVVVTKVFTTAPAITAQFPINLDFAPDWFSHDDGINHQDGGYTCRIVHYQRNE